MMKALHYAILLGSILLPLCTAQVITLPLSLSTIKYYLPVNVGTPSQEMKVVVDTGSVLLYFPEEKCTFASDEPCRPPRFNPQASSTFKDLKKKSTSSYTAGYTVYVKKITDVLSVGGVEADNVRMGMVYRYDTDGQQSLPYSGILGLAPPTSKQASTSLLAAGIKSGQLGEPIMSLYLKPDPSTSDGASSADQAGYMTLSGWDQKYIDAGSELRWTPVYAENTAFWTVYMTDVQFEPKSGQGAKGPAAVEDGRALTGGPGEVVSLSSLCDGKCKLFVDSGGTVLTTTNKIRDRIYEALGADSKGVVPCDSIDSLPDFTFNIGGGKLSMPASAYTYKQRNGNCKLWFRGGNKEWWTGGFPFVRHFYTVHDYGNRVAGHQGTPRLGIAKAAAAA